MSCSKCVPSFCISSLTRKPTALRHLSKSACGHCFLSRSPWIKPTFYTRTNSRRSPDCLNDVQYCGVCILPREFQRRRSYTLASSAHTFGVRDNASENCVQGLTSSGTSNERDISVLAGTPKGLERLKEAFCDESTRGALTPELQNRLVTACFTFALDRFQREALDALIESRNVILSAPTGSGKTVVGEMAILLALARNLRVFYTTPLKALSNQKFLDFKKLFGDSRVGLLTGDIAVNRDAEIVVMTTEVYRNMLYANGSGTDGSMIPVTDDVFAVVFDEFHYLNDPERGTVWEESVVNSPNHVLLVALSATMANSPDLRDWFADVHGPTSLIESNHRPVPLKFSFCDREGLTPLFADESVGSASRLTRRRRTEKSSGTLVDSARPKLHPSLLSALTDRLRNKDRERIMRLQKTRTSRKNVVDVTAELEVLMGRQSGDSFQDKSRRRKYRDVPSYPFVVRVLHRREMLPAIIFIFSRNGCDRAAMAAGAERTSLVTAAEKKAISDRLIAFTEENPGLVSEERILLALRGIASHHAGLLPIWKSCVEELFQENLIKVVFATETLAAGINMPARTTVISTLSKRSGEDGVVSLSTSQVLQMAGRAGRRGKDVVGYSAIMQSPFEGPLEAFRTVTAGVDALNSHFSPSYGMVLNLLQTRSLDDARLLVERSFGSFLQKKRVADRHAERAGTKGHSEISRAQRDQVERAVLKKLLRKSEDILSELDEKEFSSYTNALERVKAERRALRYLERQSKEMNSQVIEDTLPFAPTGTRIRLQGSRVVGESRGGRRRRKRRELTQALESAVGGDGGSELEAYFLDNGEDYASDFEEEVESEGQREVLDGILLDIAPDVGVSVLFSAVCANGQLCFFNHKNVENIFFDDQVVDVDAIVPAWRLANLPPKSSWSSVTTDQYFAPLPAAYEPLVDIMQSRIEHPAPLDAQGHVEDQAQKEAPDVTAQRQKLEHSILQVRNHRMHGAEETLRALRARKACRHIRALLTSNSDMNDHRRTRQRASGRFDEENQKLAEKLERFGEDVAQDHATMDQFSDFMDIVRVAQEYGFLDSEYAVTAVGDIGAKVRAENELWISLVLLDTALEDASPVHFSAIMGAVLTEGGRQEEFVAYEPSQETLSLVENLQPLRQRLMTAQEAHGVDIPVSLDIENLGLIEAWAAGESWVDLLRNTSLQEGDVCRVLRRVLDILRQIPRLPFLSEKIKQNARRALTLASRFPVVDDQTYFVRENEKAYPEYSTESSSMDSMELDNSNKDSPQ